MFPAAVVSPVEGLRAALGPGVEVVHGWGARIRRGLEPVSAGQVTDPGTGEPGVGVRFLDGDGAVLHAEHRLAGKLIWMGREVVAADGQRSRSPPGCGPGSTASTASGWRGPASSGSPPVTPSWSTS